jgi:NAD(P)-dependent dehydrogenase (short-subunit alcohol dehydrogenase family)
MIRDDLSRLFSIEGQVALITGGAGLLGQQHAAAVLACGGIPVILDIDSGGLSRTKRALEEEFSQDVVSIECDITSLDSITSVRDQVLTAIGRIDILINNAARNPKFEVNSNVNFSRLENFATEQWDLDLSVGLGGAFHCSRIFGSHMATSGQGGVIINIASDLGIIAPDQRIYSQSNLDAQMQPVKPVTYSVVKHGLIGLTKYLATYWCDQGVRCNSLSPGGVYTNQDEVFVQKLTHLIPLGRMARFDEYRGAVAFLCSNASSYMNGANLVMDGGRSVW